MTDNKNTDEMERILDMVYNRKMKVETPALQASREQTHAALQDADRIAYDMLRWDAAGYLWFAVSHLGLVGVQMGDVSESDFVAYQEKRLRKSLIQDAARTDIIKKQLRDYLTGKRANFDIEIDWRHVSDFQAQVLRQAMQIPRGEVLTYGELAQRIGKPKSARAVGRALGTNPIPIVIPCHRIIAADGSLTGYIGGVEVKATLLKMEGYLSAT